MEKKTFSISVDKEAVEDLDEVIRKKGRFANRSQAVEYCIKQFLALEKHEERSMEHLIDFIELLERHPGVGEKFIKIAKGELDESFNSSPFWRGF